jgi:uncharacterized membrane protein YfcA
MISIADEVVLLSAGVLAGMVGTAGGITSLVSYPALLAVGVPALAANVANIVAFVGCWPGSALASRLELEGRGHWLIRWAPLSPGWCRSWWQPVHWPCSSSRTSLRVATGALTPD